MSQDCDISRRFKGKFKNRRDISARFSLYNGTIKKEGGRTYVEKFLNKDFIISSADYFNYNFARSETYLSETFIDAVQQQNAYEDGGRLYSSQVAEDIFSAETDAVTNYNKDKDGNPLIALYGADDFLINSMDVIEGEIDWEAL